MASLRTVNLNTTPERIFQIPLKNGSAVEFKFSPIAATGDRLWQMFATTEALDTLEQLIKSEAEPVVAVDEVAPTKSARKSAPAKKK
jgi:hypothetical protein